MSCCNQDCKQGRTCPKRNAGANDLPKIMMIEPDPISMEEIFAIVRNALAGFGLGSAIIMVMVWAGWFR